MDHEKHSVPLETVTRLVFTGFRDVPSDKVVSWSKVFRWLEEKHDFYIDRKTVAAPNEIVGFEYWLRSSKFESRYVGLYKRDEKGKIDSLEVALNFIDLLNTNKLL